MKLRDTDLPLNSSPTTTNRSSAAIAEFRKLHETDGILFLGNAWDAASAIALEQAGFSAIGTTSYGIARASGMRDGEEVPFARQVSIVRDMAERVNIPVSADIEAGYASAHAEIVDNALRVADAGAAGLNIEDSPKDWNGLRDTAEHARLLNSIRSALDARGFDGFFLNARTDTYLMPGTSEPLEETLLRLRAYADSGANGIFVPGLSADADITAVVSASPIPLNVMSLPGLTSVARLQELGVKRFSFGNALADLTLDFLRKSADALHAGRDTGFLYETLPN
ncbi:carboxyphosphonoenolpyruvate phosphonomutase [Saccharibacillus sp. O23]|uniref:isocitrate lyase/PEP mutase family protein n=1 Tax=Saccharibacillus sp. O23 TaxID=2009338 RepID=UPI000B4E3AC4|nr:isocitrate lyase/phosphoenolpyruvate mutase family protein [Saccharibacillus sp. O23]OWR30031.1 carboxyphosphonoenolpyruvate phosphonomutase [Saccharibacillus sp. O23]